MSTTDQTARVQVTLSTATDVVSFPYKFLESNDLVVTSDGRGALVLDTDYSVTGAGETAGGNVTMIGGTIAERITVTRSTDNSQELSISTNGPLSSSGIEAALDKLTKITQDQEEEIARALMFPQSELNGFSRIISNSSDRSGKVLSFDENGVLNTNVNIAESSEAAAAALVSQLAAASSATDAEAAQTLAEAAQTAAESAETGAEAAQVLAESAQTSSELAYSNALAALTDKADKDGSNLEAESISEGNLAAAVVAKINANDGAFEGWFDASAGAPVDTTGSMVAYTADSSYWKVSTAGNGYATIDRAVWNGGTTGVFATDFDLVAGADPAPADGTISRVKIDAALEADIAEVETFKANLILTDGSVTEEWIEEDDLTEGIEVDQFGAIVDYKNPDGRSRGTYEALYNDLEGIGCVPDNPEYAELNRVAIQAALDIGVIVTGKREGVYYVNGNGLSGGSEACLTFPSNSGMILNPFTTIKQADGTSCYMIRNSDYSGGNSDIVIKGGIWDANGDNQTRDDTLTGDDYIANFMGTAFRFRNVENIKIIDVTIKDSTSFSTQFGACKNLEIKNIKFSQNRIRPNMDGVHISAGCEDVTIDGIYGDTGDDSLAIVDDATVTTNGIYGLGVGAIRRVHVRNISCGINTSATQTERSLRPFRIICYSQTVEDITIEGVYGSYRNGSDISTFAQGNSTGNIRNLVIRDYFATSPESSQLIDVEDVVVESMSIDGINCTDTGTVNNGIIVNNSTVGKLIIRDFNFSRASGTTPRPIIVNSSSTINSLIVAESAFSGGVPTQAVVRVDSAIVTNLILNSLSYSTMESLVEVANGGVVSRSVISNITGGTNTNLLFCDSDNSYFSNVKLSNILIDQLSYYFNLKDNTPKCSIESSAVESINAVSVAAIFEDTGTNLRITGSIPIDLTSLSLTGKVAGDLSNHDGSSAKTSGPAIYSGSIWVSLVDGSTIT